MSARTISKNDIIEIVQHDGNSRMNLRRVKVRRMVRTPDQGYQIIGVNMKGNTPMEYTLPRLALRKIIKTPNSIGWFPYDDSAPADE